MLLELRRDRPIVLVGMPGAGKTTVGRLLAARLELPFHGSDEAVVEASGRSIADLFDEAGEAAFRALERGAIARLLDGAPLILATGGGALVDAATRTLVGQRAFAVWLDADIETLADRLHGDVRRPLLGKDLAAALASLVAERRHLYAAANLRVVTDGRTPRQVVNEIVARLT